MRCMLQVLLVSLAQCAAAAATEGGNGNNAWGVVQEEVSSSLLPAYLGAHPNSSLVLQRLWVLNRKSVLLAMVELHAKEPGSITRLLDVCQELQVNPKP